MDWPLNDDPYRIFGIDPGSDTMGTSVVDYDLRSGRCVLQYAATHSGSQLMRDYPRWITVYGERATRLWSHEAYLLNLMQRWQPHYVISESPFMGRFPQAYASLVECMHVIQRAVRTYDEWMPLHTVDPPTVKAVVGVKAKGSTKDDVKQALLGFTFLENPHGIDIAGLDEHSIDAIVVALTRAKQFADLQHSTYKTPEVGR